MSSTSIVLLLWLLQNSGYKDKENSKSIQFWTVCSIWGEKRQASENDWLVVSKVHRFLLGLKRKPRFTGDCSNVNTHCLHDPVPGHPSDWPRCCLPPCHFPPPNRLISVEFSAKRILFIMLLLQPEEKSFPKYADQNKQINKQIKLQSMLIKFPRRQQVPLQPV